MNLQIISKQNVVPDFEGIEEMSPLESEGQSPIEKYLALTDIQAGLKAVEYFIRTGELSPNIDWVKQLPF